MINDDGHSVLFQDFVVANVLIWLVGFGTVVQAPIS
jgi:hypothetical protein